jgi:membrane-bound serine protease (ClpP class)
VLFFAILRFLPARVTGGIVSDSSIVGVPDADSAEESDRQKALLLGAAGICESPLRPAGIISLEDGRRVDVVADGEFIEKGERVVVRDCTSTRIVVSRAEETG